MPASASRSHPKQDRAVATRATIIHGAAKVFVEHGFAAATLARISNETKVTNGAFYHHFETREAVALAVIDEYNATITKIVSTASRDQKTALASIIAISAAFADQIQRDVIVQAGLVLTTEQTPLIDDLQSPYETWIGALLQAIRLAHAQGDIREHLPLQDLASYLVASFTGLQLVSAALTGRRDLGERIRQGWGLLIPMIVPDDRQESARGVVAAQFAEPAV